MKVVYIIAILVILGGGYYFFTNQASAPETSIESTPESEEDAAFRARNENQLIVKEPSGPDAVVEVSNEEVAAAAQVFEVRGTNFAFDVPEIRVQEGDTVTIHFESNDGFHDWVVDEFDAATEQVRPGTPTSVTFVADKAGTYEYYCSVGSHREQGMIGTLIVE